MATWAPIKGWEGSYEVSDEGQVRSLPRVVEAKNGVRRALPGRVLRALPNSKGYLIVGLSRSGLRHMAGVHRLVGEAFIGPLPAGLQTCHNDGNKLNNALSNLRYDTQAGNMQDAIKHGTRGPGLKTHCKHGHEFTAENTYMQGVTKVCRTCVRNRKIARYAAVRAQPDMAREVRDDQHGTLTGYLYGCHCHECMAASREYGRKYRAENRDAINAAARRSRAAARQDARTARYSAEASKDEVKQWAKGLGFPVAGSLVGRNADLLVARYNREHPDRPYIRPSEREAS